MTEDREFIRKKLAEYLTKYTEINDQIETVVNPPAKLQLKEVRRQLDRRIRELNKLMCLDDTALATHMHRLREADKATPN